MYKEISKVFHFTSNAPPTLCHNRTGHTEQLQTKTFSFSKSLNMKKLLKNDIGEANYFSTAVFIFITVLLLAFIIDLFSIISTKQQLDSIYRHPCPHQEQRNPHRFHCRPGTVPNGYHGGLPESDQ